MAEASSVDTVKQAISREMDDLRPRLIEISHTVHANPEILFEEHKAAALLTGELEREGFTVERGVAGLETAFVATYGSGKPRVAFLAEYDALPGIGHACGHNLIAVWALGAGIAVKRAMPDLKGTVQVIGTPAEEGGGGKVIMADAGVFRGLDAAIMMHAQNGTYLQQGSLAVANYQVEFFGKAAHASAFPHEGISALDALLQVFFSVNAMRQMLKSDARVHGNITHGGDAPNIIPDYAAGRFLLRSSDQNYVEELEKRFLNIVEGAALATGARSKATRLISYKSLSSNPVLTEALRVNGETLGIRYETPPGHVGSSDIGDVSQVVPTIQPYMGIADKGIVIHSPEFREAAISARADDAAITGATLLAWTGADVLLRPDLREQVRAAFRERLGREPQE